MPSLPAPLGTATVTLAVADVPMPRRFGRGMSACDHWRYVMICSGSRTPTPGAPSGSAQERTAGLRVWAHHCSKPVGEAVSGVRATPASRPWSLARFMSAMPWTNASLRP
jgi:hypothetical protein